jgi:23S rRNA pseudouridine1911/1915/1917 synthase
VPKKITLEAKKRVSRLDHFLKEFLPHISRTKTQKLIQNRRVRINDRIIERKNTEVMPGDSIEIEIDEYIPEKPLALQAGYKPSIRLKKLFEDDYLLVIDKPAGIPVHPGAGSQRETIMDIFLYNYPAIRSIPGTSRPGIVHRLDRDTSGILILAKDEMTLARMQKKFKKRQIRKSYLALISGKMRYKNGVIDAPISRHQRERKKFAVSPREQDLNQQAREAVTSFSVLLEFDDSSLIRLNPLTGRTHQIRVHLSHFGNPILGDILYGRKQNFERLALHASSIGFTHPASGRPITVNSSLPPVFRQYIRAKLNKQKS